MTAPTGTLERLLEVERSFLGVTESPFGSNRQRFSADLNRPPEAWCADFAVDCARLAGVKLPGDSAATWLLAAAYQHAGRWGHTPRVGAFVFFRWPGEPRPTSHVGTVEAVNSDGSVITIEGNTDYAGGGSGGRVMRQRRTAYIVGYGYNTFAASSPHSRPPATRYRTGPLLRHGSTGKPVELVQDALNHHGADPKLRVDGTFGDNTERELRQFQHRAGLRVDGEVGPITYRALGIRAA